MPRAALTGLMNTRPRMYAGGNYSVLSSRFLTTGACRWQPTFNLNSLSRPCVGPFEGMSPNLAALGTCSMLIR